MLVDRLSVLLELKLLPPVKPSRCLDRDLSSCEVVDWKTDEVAVLGFAPVSLGPVGLLWAAGGPRGVGGLALGLVGLPDYGVGLVGRPVSVLAPEGAGGLTDLAAMVILASSRSWCFFLFTRATTSLPSLLTAPSQ